MISTPDLRVSGHWSGFMIPGDLEDLTFLKKYFNISRDILRDTRYTRYDVLAWLEATLGTRWGLPWWYA
jgi:hypothetical protein